MTTFTYETHARLFLLGLRVCVLKLHVLTRTAVIRSLISLRITIYLIYFFTLST